LTGSWQRVVGPATLTAAALYAAYSPETVYAKEKPAVDLNQVRGAIVKVIEDDADKRGDGTSLVSLFFAMRRGTIFLS
jgi:hypothetical protein